ncbi:hypothetical protein CO725_13680 [Vibrio parahaemolyticus]|uniref:hypothetical protein n=1 Tax=Vibrio parahaemolyticus TaxID=670 RepID=UPI000BE45583|nr:hypothetical protein [Vibrio parahaemolyticus]ATI46682.1 hypothetical protein CO725_13680 [Vibrio parahaemolyticus]
MENIVELPITVANNNLKYNTINNIVSNLSLPEFKLLLLIISHRDMLIHFKTIKEEQKFSFPIKIFKEYYSKNFSKKEIKVMIDNISNHKYIKSIDYNLDDNVIISIDSKLDEERNNHEKKYKINLNLIKEKKMKLNTTKIIFLLNYHKTLKLNREDILDFLGYADKSKEQRTKAKSNIIKTFNELQKYGMIECFDYHRTEKYHFFCKSNISSRSFTTNISF